MAISSTCHWHTRTSASNGNAGGFDPTYASGISDVAFSAANTTAPVGTSVTYSAVAGDVGNWWCNTSGTNGQKGFFQITAVNAGAFTIDASPGHWYNLSGTLQYTTGIATTGTSLTNQTGSIDYSQVDSPVISLSNGASAGSGATLTDVSAPFTPVMKGNNLNIASGTNATAGNYTIQTVNSTSSVTLDRNCTTGVGASIVFTVGGALKDPGVAAASMVTIKHRLDSGDWDVLNCRHEHERRGRPCRWPRRRNGRSYVVYRIYDVSGGWWPGLI